LVGVEGIVDAEQNSLILLLAIFFIIVIFVIFFAFIAYKSSERGEVDLTEIEKANSDLKTFKVYFLGWVVEYSSKSVEVYYQQHDKFTWVSPTWYVIDSNGNVIEKVYDKDFVEKSKKWGVKVLPLVANEGFQAEVCRRIFENEDIRKKVIEKLLQIVLERGYDGINIDFEGIYPEDRDKFTQFMKELYTVFKKHGKIVSIDVAAKTSDVKTGWAGPYDYKELGKYTDLFIIMIYDYHWPGGQPGPISSLDWFEKVLDYALQTVPKEKIVAGIPFYGYDWPASGRAKGLTYVMAIELAKKYGVKVIFDNKEGEATFTYTIGWDKHTVWFNIAKSTELRIQIALKKGVNKIAAWRVGQEDPLTWKVIERP